MNICKFKEKLSAYMDDSLSDMEMREMRSHLKSGSDCNCVKELHSLHAIENLVKSKLFMEPPEQYWEDVPVKIMKRLGIVQQRTFIRNVFEEVQALFAMQRLRFGFAVAAVVLTALILFKTAVINPGKEQQVVKSKQSSAIEITKKAIENPITESTTNEKQISPGSVNTEEIRDQLPSGGVQELELVAVRAIRDTKIYFDQNKEIAPLPNSEFIIPDLNDENISPDPDVSQQTFSQKFAGSNDDVNLVPENESEQPPRESDFTETLWIVQQSESLSEKINIWNSYIKREQNSTYRTMGVYNLALVYIQIAQEAKNADKAQEALDFINENRTLLQPQMTKQRFDNIILMLGLIINRN